MQYHISHVPDSIGERWWRMLMDETINELPYDITLPHRTLVSLTTSLFELTIYRSWTNFSWIATESGGLHQWPVPAVYTKNSACPFTVSLLRCTPFEDVFFHFVIQIPFMTIWKRQLNNHFNHNNSKLYPLNYAFLIKHDTLIFLYFVYSFLRSYPVISYI